MIYNISILIICSWFLAIEMINLLTNITARGDSQEQQVQFIVEKQRAENACVLKHSTFIKIRVISQIKLELAS